MRLDADLLREARVVAAEEGRFISGLLTDRLEALVRERKMFDKARLRASPRCAKAWTCSGRPPGRATIRMSDRCFVGTSILTYADRSAGAKHEHSRALVEGTDVRNRASIQSAASRRLTKVRDVSAGAGHESASVARRFE